MPEGRVRLRSNVVDSSDAWDLVPGEVLAIHRPDLLRAPNRPKPLQVDERMYYVSCGVCGRFEHVFMREGCDQCSHGPTPVQMEEARALQRTALEAVERERRRLTGDPIDGETA
jgi:hypothetical protein